MVAEQSVGSAQTIDATRTAKPQSRLEWLDSIRGLAALVVLIGHVGGAFAWPGWTRHLNAMFDGRVAVTMFFVLSGFVLALPYIGHTGAAPRRFLWANFFTRRITRIWLPWVAVFWLSWLAREFVPRNITTEPALTDWARSFWSGPLDAVSIIKQHLYSSHDPATLLLPQDWSLRVELQGSFLIPIFVLLFRRNAWLVVVLAVALTIARSHGYYMLSFAVGLLLAGFRNDVQRLVSGRSRATLVLLGGVAFALIQSRPLLGVERFSDRFVWNLGTVGCGLALAVAMGSSRVQWALSRKPLVFLGRVSYSLYLIQIVVILCALPPLIHALNSIGIHEPNTVLAITMAAAIGITIGASAVLHCLVEQPCIDFGHWLGKFLRF